MFQSDAIAGQRTAATAQEAFKSERVAPRFSVNMLLTNILVAVIVKPRPRPKLRNRIT